MQLMSSSTTKEWPPLSLICSPMDSAVQRAAYRSPRPQPSGAATTVVIGSTPAWAKSAITPSTSARLHVHMHFMHSKTNCSMLVDGALCADQVAEQCWHCKLSKPTGHSAGLQHLSCVCSCYRISISCPMCMIIHTHP